MKILVTGAGGQDGQLLIPMLEALGHEVYGTIRQSMPRQQINNSFESKIIGIDLTLFGNVVEVLNRLSPEVIINFGAFSSVRDSWNEREKVLKINYELPLLVLDWILKNSPSTRFIQASSSEIFGSVSNEPQNENTLLRPLTPYGYSKAKIHEKVIEYRDNYNLQTSNLIFYNHESLNRSTKYVSRHVSTGVAKIYLGHMDSIEIGNVAATRDWGWASEYMSGVCEVVSRNLNSEYLFATGNAETVNDMLQFAFSSIGESEFTSRLRISPSELRMADPINLRGDASKAQRELGWNPKVFLRDFMPKMVAHDIAILSTSKS